MTVGGICNRNVVVAPKGEAIVDAANVLSVVASDPGHLSSLLVSDAMSSELVTTREDTCFVDAIKLMQERGVRRLPIVDQDGGLVGILTFDDVVRFFAEGLGELVKVMPREGQMEQRYRV